MKHKPNTQYTDEVDDYIRAYSDIFIQYLFGSPENTDLLLDFINSVQTYYGFPLLAELEVLNPFNLRDAIGAKLSILDVKAKGSDGRLYNVEVQVGHMATWRQRSLYYWAKLYSGQLTEGEEYKELHPAISINILNFLLFPELEQSRHAMLLTHKDFPDKVLTDHFQMYYLELPKIKPEFEAAQNELDKWLMFLKFEGREDLNMEYLLKDEATLLKANAQYQKFTQDDANRMAYESRMKYLRDKVSSENEARREGLVEGEANGDLKARRQTAKAMRDEKLPADLIVRITGLSLEEIERL